MKRPYELLGVKVVGGLEEASTLWAGASLLVELFHRSGVDAVANKVLPAKRSAKGLKQGRQTVESFVLLSALGGECIDYMQHLRDDVGLSSVLGYQAPASETARQWLDRFHDEEWIAGQPHQGLLLPAESKPLAGLKEVRQRVMRAYVEAVHPEWDLTLDVDAQFIETTKSDAKYCYAGYKAFQAMEVSWAETMLVLADEFREGNIPPPGMLAE